MNAQALASTLPQGAPPVRHYLQFADFTADEYHYLFTRAALIKKKFKTFTKHHTLVDRTLAMIFEKASTRTRVSFEAGMYQMGGSVQTKIESFAANSRVPVINGLTNEFHPCQILADLFTLLEHRGTDANGTLDPNYLRGKTVTWVGDGNNMANTWLQAAATLGFHLRVSTPNGYEVDEKVAVTPRGMGAGSYKTYSNPTEACVDADLVTTDVWTSMGFEAENEARRKAFAAWCVDTKMMTAAKPDALFMHCLPAHRGEEVEADVIDGPQSVVWDEAENRMHVQKALMEYLLLGRQA